MLIDLYSRRVVGWAMSERIDTALANGGSVCVSAAIPETPEQEVKRLRKEIERLRMEGACRARADALHRGNVAC